MTAQPGSLSSKMPRRDGSEVVRRIEELQAGQRQNAAAQVLQKVNIPQGGITLRGGSVVVDDSSGNVIGSLGVDPTNATQRGFVTRRVDGSLMLASFPSGLGGFVYTALCAIGGIPVVQDDPVFGGLGRPFLSLGQWVDNAPLGQAAPTTTVTGTWVTQQVAMIYRNHARVFISAVVNSSSAGTTGNVQMLDFLGATVGSSIAVPANATTSVTLGPVAWPTWAYLDSGTVSLQAQRTAGTGTVSIRGIGIWGVSN